MKDSQSHLVGVMLSPPLSRRLFAVPPLFFCLFLRLLLPSLFFLACLSYIVPQSAERSTLSFFWQPLFPNTPTYNLQKIIADIEDQRNDMTKEMAEKTATQMVQAADIQRLNTLTKGHNSELLNVSSQLWTLSNNVKTNVTRLDNKIGAMEGSAAQLQMNISSVQAEAASFAEILSRLDAQQQSGFENLSAMVMRLYAGQLSVFRVSEQPTPAVMLAWTAPFMALGVNKYEVYQKVDDNTTLDWTPVGTYNPWANLTDETAQPQKDFRISIPDLTVDTPYTFRLNTYSEVGVLVSETKAETLPAPTCSDDRWNGDEVVGELF